MRAVLDVKKGISHMKREMDEVSKNFDNLYAKTVGTSFKFERMRAEVDKLKDEVQKLQSKRELNFNVLKVKTAHFESPHKSTYYMKCHA